EPLSIDELAQHAGMSRRNFLRRFKAATGAMPGAYLQMLRIAAARQMLEEGEPSVQKVGSAVGYDNVTFFRQIFRRHTGVTPAEYRSRFKPLPPVHAVSPLERLLESAGAHDQTSCPTRAA